MKVKTILFFLLIFSHIGLIVAQDPGTNPDSPDLDIDPEKIDIVKPFEHHIAADAVKIEFSPDLPSPEEIKKNQPTFGNLPSSQSVLDHCLSASYIEANGI